MKTHEVSEKLCLNAQVGEFPTEYFGVYVGDLLSRAMSHVSAGDIWITIMNNVNVIAVASLTEAACVILAEGVTMDDKTLEVAREREVAVFTSQLTSYELCRQLALSEL